MAAPVARCSQVASRTADDSLPGAASPIHSMSVTLRTRCNLPHSPLRKPGHFSLRIPLRLETQPDSRNHSEGRTYTTGLGRIPGRTRSCCRHKDPEIDATGHNSLQMSAARLQAIQKRILPTSSPRLCPTDERRAQHLLRQERALRCGNRLLPSRNFCLTGKVFQRQLSGRPNH